MATLYQRDTTAEMSDSCLFLVLGVGRGEDQALAWFSPSVTFFFLKSSQSPWFLQLLDYIKIQRSGWNIVKLLLCGGFWAGRSQTWVSFNPPDSLANYSHSIGCGNREAELSRPPSCWGREAD